MTQYGRFLIWLGALGLVIGFLPLALIGMVNPKSTAVGPGLLMVLVVPPSLLCLGLGLVIRQFGRFRDGRRSADDADTARGGDFWRGEPTGPLRHNAHDRHDRAA